MKNNQKIDRYEQIMAILNLSDRQYKIIEMLEQGLRPKIIQAQLGISQASYNLSVYHVFESTGIAGRKLPFEKKIELVSDLKKDAVNYIKDETEKEKHSIMKRTKNLTENKKNVLQEMLKGAEKDEIAKTLNMTKESVQAAKSYIYNQMGVNKVKGPCGKKRIMKIVATQLGL